MQPEELAGIKTTLQSLRDDVRALTVAIAGDDKGNDGLARTFRTHIQLDEKRYEAQVNWNNATDKKIAWYIGGAAGIGLAIELLSTVIPHFH